MCGLVYIRRKDGKPANRSVRKRYYKQKYRGSSGFGYVAIRDNTVVSYKRATTEHEIMNLLQKETASEILFHHRFPTSTPNLDEQAHPLFVEGGGLEHSYFVAHNGVIRNPDTRKTAHEKLGFQYLTELKPFIQTASKKMYNFGYEQFNDSEALAVDTALALEGKEKNILSEGPAAVIGFTMDGQKVVDRFFYRNTGNPLKYHEDHVMVELTSSGRGAEIESVWVMRLKDSGFEKHPINVWTPWMYRGTPITPTIHLPAKTTHSVEPVHGDITWDYTDSDPELFEIEESTKESRDYLLSSIPTETLWDEYGKASTAKKELEEALAAFDARITRIGSIDDAMLKHRGRLQKRLDKVKIYENRVSLELETREVLTINRKTT